MLIANIKPNDEEPEVFSNCVESMEEPATKRDKVVYLHTISLKALCGTEAC